MAPNFSLHSVMSDKAFLNYVASALFWQLYSQMNYLVHCEGRTYVKTGFVVGTDHLTNMQIETKVIPVLSVVRGTENQWVVK